jgi:hypothetical protein
MPLTTTETGVRVLDRPVWPGLFGVKFWDVAAGAAVQDGLIVQARSRSGKVVDAVQNRCGVWHFPELPGINSVDVGRALAEGASLSASSRPVVVRVVDAARRFQTTEFDAVVPIAGGLLDWPQGPCLAGEESPLGAGRVPLFSRTSRSAPPGHSSVRADLWDVDADRAAAWALLEISVAGPSGPLRFLGLSDERGSAVTFLPAPFVPVDGVRMPAALRTWDVAVRIAYAPAFTTDLDPDASRGLPSLDAILAQYEAPDARVFTRRSPDVVLAAPGGWPEPLRAIEPLILRTEPAGLEPRHRSFLLIQPAP